MVPSCEALNRGAECRCCRDSCQERERHFLKGIFSKCMVMVAWNGTRTYNLGRRNLAAGSRVQKIRFTSNIIIVCQCTAYLCNILLYHSGMKWLLRGVNNQTCSTLQCGVGLLIIITSIEFFIKIGTFSSNAITDESNESWLLCSVCKSLLRSFAHCCDSRFLIWNSSDNRRWPSR